MEGARQEWGGVGRAAAASSQEQGAWGSRGRSPPTSVWVHPARRVLTPAPIFLASASLQKEPFSSSWPVTWLFDHRENTLISVSRPRFPSLPKILHKTGKQSSTYPIFRIRSPSLSLLYRYFGSQFPKSIHFLPNLLWSLPFSTFFFPHLCFHSCLRPPTSLTLPTPASSGLYPLCPSPDKCPTPRGQPARRRPPAQSLPTYCEEQLRPPVHKSQVQVTRRAQRIRALPRSSPWEPESLSPRSYTFKVR